jgi:hypothetical protein
MTALGAFVDGGRASSRRHVGRAGVSDAAARVEHSVGGGARGGYPEVMVERRCRPSGALEILFGTWGSTDMAALRAYRHDGPLGLPTWRPSGPLWMSVEPRRGGMWVGLASPTPPCVLNTVWGAARAEGILRSWWKGCAASTDMAALRAYRHDGPMGLPTWRPSGPLWMSVEPRRGGMWVGLASPTPPSVLNTVWGAARAEVILRSWWNGGAAPLGLWRFFLVRGVLPTCRPYGPTDVAARWACRHGGPRGLCGWRSSLVEAACR